MQNLFALNSGYRIAYWLIWLFFTAVYGTSLVFFIGLDWFEAILDALVFGSFFALMGVPIWYIVKFSGLGSTNLINTLATHLVAAAVLVFSIVTGSESALTQALELNQFYNFSSEYHIYRLMAGGLIYILITINFYLVFYYEEYRNRKQREVELDKDLKSAELNMLKAQINPHFVFNSLNSVSSLTLTNPEKAHRMVIQLAEFLRYSIRKNAEQLVSLEQEIEAIELYLAIEKTRYGDRLKVQVKCDEGVKKKQLPALILQPLIENAIKYGLHETDIKSKIEIACEMTDFEVTIIVSNNFDKEAVVRKGEGIGLENVRSRLELVYGRNDLLTTSIKDTVFIAEITLPQL